MHVMVFDCWLAFINRLFINRLFINRLFINRLNKLWTDRLIFLISDESKFPDTLPNESWGYEVVWFQLEPEDSYVIRNKPATLVCRVASALKVKK
jgi:hypothetical protein